MVNTAKNVLNTPGASGGRAIHLPLESLDKCTYCSKTAQDAKLSWCTSCVEVSSSFTTFHCKVSLSEMQKFIGLILFFRLSKGRLESAQIKMW